MYPPAYFSDNSLAAALDVARATKFATVVTIDGGKILPVHVPVSLLPQDGWGDPERPEFVGHVIVSNPLCALLKQGDARCTIIFQPASGYVSPSVYDEKPRTGRVVPTWNYVAAHFEAQLHLVPDGDGLRRILTTQIADYEGAVGGTWRLEDAPSDYIDQKMTAIVGFSAVATTWKTVRKLSQNKPDERRNAAAWLEANPLPASSIGYWMG